MKIVKVIFLLTVSLFVTTACNKKENTTNAEIVKNEQKSDNEIPLVTENFVEVEEKKSIVYVCTDGSKINYREDPVDGEILGQFENGQRLHVWCRTNELSCIDGIYDYWYCVHEYGDPSGGWIFGGFLSNNSPATNKPDSFDLNLLIGKWENENYKISFSENEVTCLIKTSEKEWHSDWNVWKENVIQINHPRYGEESAMDGISWTIDTLSDAELKVENNKLSAIVLRRVE